MPSITRLDSGFIDRRDSAFPMAVQLPRGDILCSFSVGGGPDVTGGTDVARSMDHGTTWHVEGTILPHDPQRGRANFLKLSAAPDGRTVYAYGAWITDKVDKQFGQRDSRAILCRSTDEGRTWSAPVDVPTPVDCPLEVSHGLLALRSGRLLAPAATLPEKDRLGEQVFAAVSDDDGASWTHRVVFADPDKRRGFFEQKLAEVAPNRILATAWTVTLGDYVDQCDSFAISNDGGLTWGPCRSTGIRGQTLTPVSLGDDRLLVLYNRRYGEQGIVMCLVRFTEEAWRVEYEGLMYDARARRERPAEVASGIDEMATFAFGYPTAIRLRDGSFLATHWCVEEERCGVRWTRLHVDW